MKIKKSVIIFDFIIIPLLIFLFSFNPFFAHGPLVSIDEGQHLSWINAIFHGQIPYRDTYLIYGSIYELIPAAIMCVVGKSIAVLRALHHFGMIFWLIIAYLFGRLILKRRLFAYLLAWLLIATRVVPFWSSRWGGLRNGIPFLTIVFLSLFTKKKRFFWLYLAGLCNGVSLLYTQEAGIAMLLASGVFILAFKWFEASNRKKSFFKLGAIYLGGIMSIILPIFLYLGINNALGTYLKICFIDIPFKFPKYFVDVYPYMGLLPKTNILKTLSNPPLAKAFLFCVAFAGYIISFVYIAYWAIRKKESKEDMDTSLEMVNILTLSIFGFFLLIFAIRQIHGMQFNIAVPPLLIIGCVLWEKLFSYLCKVCQEKNISAYKRTIAFITNVSIILLMSVFIYHFTKPLPQFRYLYDNIFGYSSSRQAIKEKFQMLTLDRSNGIMVPKKQAEELEFVVNYIKNNTAPDDPIFVFPHNAEYYFLSDRVCASRFTLATFAVISPDYEDEVIEDLKRKKPEYVIYVKDAYVLTHFHPVASEERIPKIFNYIKRNYLPVERTYDTYILKRNGS